MLSSLTASVRAVILYLRISLGMESYPPLPKTALYAFPPNDGAAIPISYWCQLLVDQCTKEPSSRKYEVIEVKRCKKTNGTQHEYLLAVIRHPKHGSRRIRIERCRENVDANGAPILLDNQQMITATVSREDFTPGLWSIWTREKNEPQSPTPPRRIANGISQSTAKVGKVGKADDTVRFWELHQHPLEPLTSEKVLEVLDLSHNPFPMYQLAILANTVHDRESLYNLFKSQCYWYTNMIARVIARRNSINNNQEVGNPTSDTDHCFDPADGKFWKIPVHTVRPKIVDAIEKEFQLRCAIFEREMSQQARPEELVQQEGSRVRALEDENAALKAYIRQLESRPSPSILQ